MIATFWRWLFSICETCGDWGVDENDHWPWTLCPGGFRCENCGRCLMGWKCELHPEVAP